MRDFIARRLRQLGARLGRTNLSPTTILDKGVRSAYVPRFRGLAAPMIGVQRDKIFQHLIFAIFALIGLNADGC